MTKENKLSKRAVTEKSPAGINHTHTRKENSSSENGLAGINGPGKKTGWGPHTPPRETGSVRFHSIGSLQKRDLANGTEKKSKTKGPV